MKSIKTKIFVIVLSSIVASSVIIGGFGIIWSDKAIRQDSQQSLDLMSQLQTGGLNAMFEEIEQSTVLLSQYVSENLDDMMVFHDEDRFSRYFAKLEDITYYIANCTMSSYSVYIRFAPEYTKQVASLMWKRTKKGFELTTMPIFPVYKSDFENSWYYKARMTGSGVWSKPYFKDELEKIVISYSVPVYKDGDFFAVVGLDIDFNSIISIVNLISLYDNGYAFLTDSDFVIMYHRTIPSGTRALKEVNNLKIVKSDIKNLDLYEYTIGKKRYCMTFKDLVNSMRLVISVPKAEIDKSRNQLASLIIAAGSGITLLLCLISLFLSNKLTRPLKELSASARTIIAGKYDFKFTNRPNNEIGEVMTAFMLMAKSLKVQFDYINSLVYLDSMTGAKNRRAYFTACDEIDIKIKENGGSKKLEFGLIVFDVNDLKVINDSFGHKAGDTLIKAACNLISKNFSNSPIYRIGGDEFVVILKETDYENRVELLAHLKTEMDLPLPGQNEGFEKVSMAAGMSVFTADDKNFQTVFERADEEMYKNKISMKGGKTQVR